MIAEMKKLDTIRKPENVGGTGVLAIILMLLAGLISGVGAKLLDIYTTNLGNIGSQMSVWVFICTIISVFSATPKRAAIRVFTFCVSMLAAYYVTAELTGSVYSMTFVYGWCVFALFSPLMGFVTWYAGGRHVISKILTFGIAAAMLLIAAVMFDRVRFADIIFAAATVIVLLIKGRSAKSIRH